MHAEFESMEDYWQKKIKEERSFYDDQLRVSESLFKDLEIKMKDTENLLLDKESIKPCCDKNSLYIINEQQYLEDQVNEWQEEINELKLHVEQLKASHKDEIVDLKERFEKEIGVLTETRRQKSCNDEMQKIVCNQCGSLLSEKTQQLEESDVEQEENRLTRCSSVAYRVSISYLAYVDTKPYLPGYSVRYPHPAILATVRDRVCVTTRPRICSDQPSQAGQEVPAGALHPHTQQGGIC